LFQKIFCFPTLVDTIWLLRQFPIDLFKDYLGLPKDSTHFNTKQNKRKDVHAKLRCIEPAVTPRVLQEGALMASAWDLHKKTKREKRINNLSWPPDSDKKF
jgi:hypothetical protein